MYVVTEQKEGSMQFTGFCQIIYITGLKGVNLIETHKLLMFCPEDKRIQSLL